MSDRSLIKLFALITILAWALALTSCSEQAQVMYDLRRFECLHCVHQSTAPAMNDCEPCEVK